MNENEIGEESLLEDIENTEDIAEEDIEDHLDPDEDNIEDHLDPDEDNVDEDNDTDETEELEADDEAEKEDEEDTVYLVDGEEVTLSELQAGYSRQSDYTRKTQQVAEDRKAVVEQQQQLQQAQANVDANSHMVAAFVHQFLHEPNPNDYSAGNPAEMAQFQKDQHNYQAALQELQAFSEAFAQSQDQAQQNNHAQQIHAVQQGHQQALTSVGAELFPTSSDPTADLSGEMASVAKELGFKSQEIESTTDPRVMMLAHYASIGIQYNKDKHNRQKVQKKVKPQRVKSKQPVVSTITQSQAARKRLKGSGSIDDAIQALS